MGETVMNTPSIAVILSGCGYLDGSEIHEATLTLWAIHKHGADFQCYAPDINQYHVVNHLTGRETDERRNVLIESARIARGKVMNLADFQPEKHDALVLPGGFGAAKNLSNYAFTGPGCTINPDVEKAIRAMAAVKKPIGALCIAPAILARILPGVNLTIGQDAGTAADMEKMGATHTKTGHGEIVIDQESRVITTPCYMLDARVDQIGQGAENVIGTILEMLKS
jgi:enhancing lycopene biosynthesis protein 2